MKPSSAARTTRVLVAVLLSGLFGCSSSPSPPSPPPTPSGSAPTLPGCPLQYLTTGLGARGGSALWAPAPPGVPTEKLVPVASDPTSGVLCRYQPVEQGAQSALVGSKVLTGLDTAYRTLDLPRKAPGSNRVCTLIGGPLVPYLLRLDYPGGTVWVTSLEDANRCQDTTNGTFTSDTYLGHDLAEAWRTGLWRSVAWCPPNASCVEPKPRRS